MAFNRKDYDREKAYNDSARDYSETQDKAEKELFQVKQLLDVSYESYENEVEVLDEKQFSDVIIALTLKKEETEKNIRDLEERRKLATSRGDAAFAKANYEEEKMYNGISSKCYLEIEKQKVLVKYLNHFINDLSYRFNNKYGSNGYSK